MIELDPRSTALVLIDLQKGILGNTLSPILVKVEFSAGGADILRQPVDVPASMPSDGFPAGWSEFPPGLRRAGMVAERRSRYRPP
jgi:hypothetical protein